MPNEQIPRRLVAVLYADAVGFSRETQQGLDDTYRRLQVCRGVFAEAVSSHGGRLVDQAGDSVLAIFESAANALAAALSARERLFECQQRGEALEYRFGLNLGDVIEDQGGVYGDGVNVAARLESLASPGEIWVSASFRSALGGDSSIAFRDRGSHQVKNIGHPVSAFSIEADGEVAELARRPRRWWPLLAAGAALVFAGIAYLAGDRPAESTMGGQDGASPSSDAPRAAAVAPPQAEPAVPPGPPVVIVLPFANMGGDPSQEIFADGMTEDLITDLSGVAGLRVISSNTAFTFKGKPVTAQRVRADLNVDYVLEGRVRRLGDALRVSAQLVDARTGIQRWGERYDRQVVEVFAVQDEISSNIVRALSVNLTEREQARLSYRTTSSLAAYDLFLEGQRLARSSLPADSFRAREVLRQAIAADPEYGRAHGALAYAIAFGYRRGWVEPDRDPLQQLDRALELALRAVELNDAVPQTYWVLSYVRLIRKEFDRSLAAVRRAVEISPNYADGYGLLALISNGMGKHEDAVRYTRKGMELNPYFTWDYPYNLGLAKYFLGDYAGAIESLERARDKNPNVMPVRLALAASYVRAGRLDDAEWQVEEIRSISPQETLTQARTATPFKDPDQLERFLGDLRKAGLPE